MDIRSFFNKKPPAKKKLSANGGGGAVAAASSSSKTTAKSAAAEPSPKKKKTPNELASKKRKAAVPEKKDDDDDDAVEISPQEFFAKSNGGKSATSTKTSTGRGGSRRRTKPEDTDTTEIDKDKSNGSRDAKPSPPKKSRRLSPQRSPPARRNSPRRSARTADKEPKPKSKRRIVLESDDDDDDDDDGDGDFVMKDSENNSDDDEEVEVEVEVDPNESKRSSKRSSSSTTTTTTKHKPPPRTPPSAAKRSRASTTPTTTKTTSSSGTSPSRTQKSPAVRARAKPTPKPEIVLCEPNPAMERDSFDVDTIKAPECMVGPAFVFTGVMDNLNREDAIDLVKTLGGRVTTAVSGKTNYLVVGPVLEDGRDYKEGSKYKKAAAFGDGKVKIVMGEKQLYGLCHFYHDRAMKERGINPYNKKDSKTKTTTTSKPPPATNPYSGNRPGVAMPVASNPYAKKAPVANPYAKKGPVSNPYAKKGPANPYAKKAPANPYASSSSVAPSAAPSASNITNANTNTNTLWVDRHKPTSTREILGNQTNVKKLQTWLRTWEKTFNNSKALNKTFSNPKGPLKAALLSGPPGIGKTTTATLVAKEDGRDVLEYNASDTRSKKALQFMGDLTGSQGISFGNVNAKTKSSSSKKKPPTIQKRCIIMDEVDGMGGGDRSGISELIQMIKKSRTPIICICNDRQSQKIKSLLPYCMDLRYSRPTKNSLANRAIRIAEMEGLTVERNAAEAIAESCGNDVRQVLNLLQMWAQKKDAEGDNANALTYKKLKDRGKSIQKDEMLRVSLFDAAKLIVEGPRDLDQADDKAKLNSFFKRTDAFFVDYSFTGLIVQQNYPKVTNSQYQRIKGDDDAEIQLLERFHMAAESMSDYDLVENQIRGGDLNWSLLPTTAMLAVKTGYHAGGETGGFLGGYPEFTAWMGKNSSMGKNYRLLNELSHHMNFKVSANAQELRRSYIPVMRDRILKLLKNADAESNQEAIDLMDDYGLSRDDVVEKLDVLVLGKKGFSFDDLDSKAKAAFTRQYNSGVHKSQALVREQGGGGAAPKKKRRKEVVDEEEEELFGDSDDDSEDEVDEEKELAKLQAQFKKKGRKKAAPKRKSK